MKKNVLLLAILFFNCYYALSQTIVNAEFRPRLIIDDGYKNPKVSTNDAIPYITQRTRLNIGYKSDKLDSYFSIQDVRYWGGEDNFSSSGAFANSTSIDLNEAWFLLKPLKTISIKVGRQLWSYDDQRIISARGWNDYQVKYDAVLGTYYDSINKVDVGLTLNSETNKNLLFPVKKYKVFDFIRYERNIEDLNVSAIGVATGNTISDTTESIFLKGTYGANINYQINYTKARLSGYYQNNLNKNNSDISAFCLSLYVSQKLTDKISAGAGIDYLSGQDENNQHTDYQNSGHTFDILYGTRHSKNGYMDYYSDIPAQGLQDYMINTDIKLLKITLLQIDYHHFQLATNKLEVGNPNKIIDKNLGDEFDITIKYKPFKEVTIQTGYSVYFITSTLKTIKGLSGQKIKLPQFIYIMVLVTPKIL